jgi:hypothetical protein
MRQLAQSFYRLVGLMFVMLGAWILTVNLIEINYSGLILVWILSAGFLGVVGGVLFLLSFDGPMRLRANRVRMAGWLGIMVLALLPQSLQFVALPAALLLIPALRVGPSTSDSVSPQTQA